ncbi:hypothetical protein [Paenibacillus illinoisensis]|uniref:class II glutamine amidotransferase n=1 Tax=Paenibacillus illinoisensis TaxID=59845 RepID=UPI0030195510
MCGIGGVLMFPKERNAEELAYIRELVSNIAFYNQARGRDATGFATFSSRSHSVFKQPMKASELIRHKAYKHYIGRSLHKGTKNVLIHTRAGTKGSEENSLNNHPIESHRYIGVHNGMIHNDDELFEQHKLFRAGEVDSEVIFRLLDGQGDKPKEEGLKYVAEQLSGMFTTAFVPKSHRHLMYIIRNDNPITMVYISSLNIIAFASIDTYIRDSITDANLINGIVINMAEDTVSVQPKAQTIMRFDTNADNALEQLMQKPSVFTENIDAGYSSWYGNGNDWNFFYQSATEDAQSEAGEEDEELSEILSMLSDNQVEYLSRYLESQESNGWAEGWASGRESLNTEMEQKVGMAYDEGYAKGFEEGFMDGSIEANNTVRIPV